MEIHPRYIRHCGRGETFEGHRVPQYLIASGYECCLDTSEIARREGLESDVEMENRRKEGTKEERRIRPLSSPKSRGDYNGFEHEASSAAPL